nr:(Fe-S)-binding protein [Pelosinus baikalensis]
MEAKAVKASIFITCICDSMFPRVGEAMVRVLERQGVSLDFPPGQTCCGQPALSSGYWDDAREVAKGFIDSFHASEIIVTPAGSCLAAIKEFYPVLFEKDPKYLDRSKELIRKTHEFSEFLVEVLQVTNVNASFPYKVTYHSSCHPRRFLGVDKYVYALLKNVEKLDFIPLAHEEQCCGFGGTFSVKMPEISESMVNAKVADILATGADVVVGTDLSCLMNIDGRLRKQGAKVRVMHIAELLDEGMRT